MIALSFGRIGSGKHWGDGMYYSDWKTPGRAVSETYRAGIAAGMRDLNGYLYRSLSDPSSRLMQRGMEWGYWSESASTIKDGNGMQFRDFLVALWIGWHSQIELVVKIPITEEWEPISFF